MDNRTPFKSRFFILDRPLCYIVGAKVVWCLYFKSLSSLEQYMEKRLKQHMERTHRLINQKETQHA